MADKKLVVSLDVQTGSSVQNLEAVKDAAAQMGTDGAAGGERLARTFENIERQFGAVERRLDAGKRVTTSSVDVMHQQFTRLETQIKETFGSLESAPGEIKNAFQIAQRQIDTTITKVRDMTDAAADMRGRVSEAGESWGGLPDAIGRAAGSMGSLVGKATLFTAAFREGLSIGREFNQFIKTDMSLYDEWLGNIAAKIGAILRGGIDGAVALGGVIKAIASGDLQEAKRAFSSAMEAGKQQATILADAVRLTGAEFAAAHPYLQQHTTALDKNTDSTKKNTEASKENKDQLTTHQKFVLEMADVRKKEADALAKVEVEQKKVTEALEKHTTELGKAALAELNAINVVADRSKDMQDFGREIDRANDAIKRQQTEVEKLTAKYGENDPMTLGAIERQQQLEHSLETSRGRYDQAKTDVDRYGRAQAEAAAEVQKAKEKIDELTTQLNTLTAPVNGYTTAAQAAVVATQGLGAAAATAAPPAANVASALERTKNVGNAAGDAIKAAGTAATQAQAATESVAKSTSEIATGMERLKTAASGTDLSATVKAYQDMATALGLMSRYMDEIITKAPDATKAIDKLSKAGMEEEAA